jgi:outer membrane protein TolC
MHRYQQTTMARAPETGPPPPPTPAQLAPAPTVRQVPLSLADAIVATLRGNLDVRVAGFTPAVAREEAVKAAAAFDAVVFAGYEYHKVDEQTASIFAPGWAKTRYYQAGLREHTITGADWSLAYTLTGTREASTGFTSLSNYYEAVLELEVTQPLLRGGWLTANLAEVNLAKVNRRISDEAFREQVEQVVSDAIGTYWALVQARVDVGIRQNLLDQTLQNLDRIRARGIRDASTTQMKQVETAAESRRAELIAAQKTVRDVQDSLIRLMGETQGSLYRGCDILPITEPATEGMKVDLTDRILTALKHNPALAQVRIALEAAEIDVAVAQNETLPRLDLTASATFQGLQARPNEANHSLGTGDYAGYAVGLTAEYPLGNRAAMAELRRTRLARRQNLTELQNTTDQITQQIRERVRQVEAAYEEMLAQRAAASAAAAYLRTLQDTEEVRGMLTPEYLLTKLQAQQSVAAAQQAELAAIIVYNTALTDLDRLTGTVLQVQPVRIALPTAAEAVDWSPMPAARPAPGTGPRTVLDTYRQALMGTAAKSE